MVIMQERKSGHFYSDDDGKSWYESVTGILRDYPKGQKFYDWVAAHGAKKSEQIKTAAGSVGTKVHKAIEEFVHGATPDSLFDKYRFGPEEHMAVLGFSRWYAARKPIVRFQEMPVISHRLRIGGTIDMVAEIDGGDVLIDFKTSRHMGASFWLQLHAYAFCLAEMKLCNIKRLMILHLNPTNENLFAEYKHSYDHDGLRQFYALRFLHDFLPKNERDRNKDLGWTDNHRPEYWGPPMPYDEECDTVSIP